MRTNLLDVDGLHNDVPYSYAAVAPPGSTVFTAGACPLDAQGRVVAPGDVHAQMRQALTNLLVTLEAAACEPGDVVKTTVYVATTESADLLKAWREMEEVFGDDGPPSTLLGVTVLGWQASSSRLRPSRPAATDPLGQAPRSTCPGRQHPQHLRML